MTITGGTFEIWTGDDGIHSEYWTIFGAENDPKAVPKVKVMSAYEAIEGASVIIYNGDYELYCSDDIINAANGDLRNWSYEITIYDGTFFGSTYAGDGYDSNSALNLYGGTHIIMSDTGLGENNESLDGDGSVILSGVTLLTIGKSGMMSRYSSQSTNAYASFGSNSGMGGGMGGGFRPGQPGGDQGSQSSVSIGTGDVVTVTDASGNVVIETTAYWDSINYGRNASYVVCSTPGMTSGGSYTLTVNGSQAATASAQKAASSGWYSLDTDEFELPIIDQGTANEDASLILNVSQAEKPDVVITYGYNSEDTEIASVSETGLVTGVEKGTTVVGVTTYANGVEILSQTYEVIVTSDDDTDDGKDGGKDDTDEGKDDGKDDTDDGKDDGKDDNNDSKMPFEDVKAGDYFYNSVSWAVKKRYHQWSY